MATTRTARILVGSLAALVTALTAGTLAAGQAAHLLTVADVLDNLLLVVPYAVVGALVAWQQPRNALGWILLSAAVFFLVNTAATNYSILDYRQHGGTLPLGPVAVVLQPSWAPAIALMGISVLVFPDARLPLGRWRPVAWVFAGCAAFWMSGAFAIAISAVVTNNVRVAPGGDLVAIDHPTGAAAIWGIGQDVFFPVFVLAVLLSIARQVSVARASTGERRQQLKVLLYGAAVFTMIGPFALISSSSSTLLRVLGDVGLVGCAALPAAIGAAILRYRLFDIDRLISRTLTYAVVTACLAGAYVGLVALATGVLPFSSTVGVAISTLGAVALFNPLRQQVQRIVDRRFNRARYDAERTVAAFAAELRGAVDMDRVRADLIEVVRRAVEPTSASLWVPAPLQPEGQPSPPG